MTATRALGALVVCFAVALSAGSAGAEPPPANKERARAAWIAGMERRAQGRHDEALAFFREAHGLMDLPATGFEVASELEALGLLIEARDLALVTVKRKSQTASDRAYQALALALYDRVGPKLGVIEISVSGPPADAALRARIDGEDVPAAALAIPRRVNPGHHTVMVGASGYMPVVRTLDVAESASVRLEVTLSPALAAGREPVAATPHVRRRVVPAPADAVFGKRPRRYSSTGIRPTTGEGNEQGIVATRKSVRGDPQIKGGTGLLVLGGMGITVGVTLFALFPKGQGYSSDVIAVLLIGGATLQLGGGALMWNGVRENRAADRMKKASGVQWQSVAVAASLSHGGSATGVLFGAGGVF